MSCINGMAIPLKLAHQKYQPRPFTVEADWSGASYYYAIAAFAEQVDLQLDGLFEESVQGDSVLVENDGTIWYSIYLQRNGRSLD